MRHRFRGGVAIATLLFLSSCVSPGSRGSGVPPAGFLTELSGAASVSPSDIWAVGRYQDLGHSDAPFTEHWDGRMWTQIGAPVGRWTFGARLTAVAAAGARDVWAVGAGQNNGEEQTLIEHWDGVRWTIVSSPNASRRTNDLVAISVIGARDIWAVGEYHGPVKSQTLTEHWDGFAWTVVPAQDPAAGINHLNGVTGVSTDDVWAVGFRRESDQTMLQTLIEHWDGHRWSAVTSPDRGQSASLTGLVALTSDDVWAVGSYETGDRFLPLIEHWDGKSWTIKPGPDTFNVQVQAVAARSVSQIWFGGASTRGSGDEWLLQRWDGNRWARIAAPSAATGIVNAIILDEAGVWAIGT